MEKYNWKDDMELRIELSDRAPVPVAVTGPKFYSQYQFIIQKKHGAAEVKNFVPEWAVNIVSAMLDKDPGVKNYTYKLTYKGNRK